MDASSQNALIEQLNSRDIDTVQEGAQHWLAANDPELTAALLAGLQITPDGDEPFYFEAPGPLAACRFPLVAAFAVVIREGLLADVTDIVLSENSFTDLTVLAGLPGMQRLNLPSADEDLVDALHGFEALDRCTALTSLSLHASCFDQLSDTVVARLESLTLCYDEDYSRLPDLSGATSLKTLWLDECEGVRSLAPLAKLEKLEKLTVFNGWSISSIEPIAGLSTLRALSLVALGRCHDFEPLAELTGLVDLTISHTRAVQDLSILAGMTKLEKLKLFECARLWEIDDLAELTELVRLDIRKCRNIEDFEVLGNLEKLQDLNLSRTKVASLAFIEQLEQLQSIHLIDGKSLTEVPSLERLTQLRRFNLNGCTALTDASRAHAEAAGERGCTVLLPPS